MNRMPVTPSTFMKVHTPPLLEYVGPPARVVSTDRAGGRFSLRCRFSGAVHPFNTRFAEDSLRFRPRSRRT